MAEVRRSQNRGSRRWRLYVFTSAFRLQPSAIDNVRLGTVIGRVTLSKTVPSLEGGRWLIISPFTRDHFQRGFEAPTGLSRDFTPIIYDNIGGGVGQTIGYVEGREAAQPFDQPTPVDAFNAALVDEIFYSPLS